MEKRIDLRGLVGLFAYTCCASANNITSGILAYMMKTYAEVSSTTVAMVMTCPAIVGTIFAFAAGTLINRFGAKKMTMFIHAMLFVSGMIYLFLGNKTSVYVLWLASCFVGFLMGAGTVCISQLLTYTVADPTKRGAIYGYATAVQSLGGVFFASVGGAIAARGGGVHWERAYLLYFIIPVFIAVEFFCLPEKPRITGFSETVNLNKNNEKDDKKERVPFIIWVIAVHYSFFFLCLYTFSLNLSEYVITTHSLGTSVESGLAISIMTVGGIISGLTFGFYSKLLKKYTVPVLMGFTVLGLAMLVFIPNLYVLYVASVILGFSMMGCGPYVITELARYTTPKTYPKATSLYAGFMNVGMMVAVYVLATLAGFFFKDSTSVTGKFTIALVGSVLVCVSSFPIYARKRK
ncbi:MAG: MFS transporter [Clostridia bacterium]|nr:MFS transporter [Clostridia bacterium]